MATVFHNPFGSYINSYGLVERTPSPTTHAHTHTHIHTLRMTIFIIIKCVFFTLSGARVRGFHQVLHLKPCAAGIKGFINKIYLTCNISQVNEFISMVTILKYTHIYFYFIRNKPHLIMGK